jgi:mono/diheme cytochrome c family protein
MYKKSAGLIVSILIIALLLAACGGQATQAPQQGPAQPDVPNPGGPGAAINLTGDPVAGADVFAKCASCHGKEGKGGQSNPGSDAGVIPALNPVNPALKSADAKTFATNLDLFIEHGGTPKGSSPARSMAPFGDQQMLAPQQIADVIAYIISLNK